MRVRQLPMESCANAFQGVSFPCRTRIYDSETASTPHVQIGLSSFFDTTPRSLLCSVDTDATRGKSWMKLNFMVPRIAVLLVLGAATLFARHLPIQVFA